MKFLKLIPAIFLALFLLSFASATCASGCSINTYLEFGDTTAISKTVTQGETVDLISLVYSYGYELTSEQLVVLPNTVLFQEYVPGNEIRTETFNYKKIYNLNTNTLNPGTYTLRFLATNGYESEYSELTLVVEEKPDTTRPVVDITYPINGETYDTHRTSLSFTVDEENLDHCTYNLGNVAQTVPNAKSGSNTITGITSTEGQNAWSVTCYDMAGNYATDITIFNVKKQNIDDEDPVVKITYPNDGETYDSHRTELIFNVYETNLDYCEYKLNNEPWVNLPSPIYGTNLVPLITSIEGQNTWSVNCYDEAGNLGSDSVTFYVELPDVDETDPIVDITYPNNGETYMSHVIELKFNVIEENLDYCIYSINNGQTWANVEGAHEGQNTVAGVTSIEGENNWLVECFDKSNNEGNDKTSFYVELPDVDETDPIVNILYPEEKTYTEHVTELMFNVDEENLASCAYSLNYGPWKQVTSPQEGINLLETNINSVEGQNTWRVKCFDEAGNVGEDEVTFIVELPPVDNENPVVEISYPTNGKTYTTKPTQVNFIAEDDNLDYCEYSLNGATFTSSTCYSGIQVSGSLNYVVEGENTVVVNAYDLSGNKGTDSVTFYYEKEPVDEEKPKVTIITPVDGKTYDDYITEAKVKILDDNLDDCSYRLNDGDQVQFSCKDGINYIDNLDTVDGKNTLKVYAEDEDGNKDTDTVVFYIDKDCDDDKCEPCPNRRSTNGIKEVVSSDPTPQPIRINGHTVYEDEEEQPEVTITFGEKMFYGLIVTILLMMIMTVLMIIAGKRIDEYSN